jgi:hypothetical protein
MTLVYRISDGLSLFSQERHTSQTLQEVKKDVASDAGIHDRCLIRPVVEQST